MSAIFFFEDSLDKNESKRKKKEKLTNKQKFQRDFHFIK